MIAEIGNEKMLIKLTNRELALAGLEACRKPAGELATDAEFLERFVSLVIYPVNWVFNMSARGTVMVDKFQVMFTFSEDGGIAELVNVMLADGENPWNRVTEGSSFSFEVTDNREILCLGAHIVPGTKMSKGSRNVHDIRDRCIDSCFISYDAFIDFLLSKASNIPESLCPVLFKDPEGHIYLRMQWQKDDFDILAKSAICSVGDYAKAIRKNRGRYDTYMELFPIGNLSDAKNMFIKGLNETTEETQLLQ